MYTPAPPVSTLATGPRVPFDRRIFTDQSHLTRQFKQAFGIGPGAYRSALLR